MTPYATQPATSDAPRACPVVECPVFGPGIRAFSTTRAFDPLPGTVWSDAARRLARLCATLGHPAPERIAFARQVHGPAVAALPDDAAILDSDDLGMIARDCDVLVTSQPRLALVVRTADCLPIVLADEQAGVLAAVHAGWRGTLAGAVPAAIAAMTRLGARPAAIAAWIGPRIDGSCYEVSPAIIDQFHAAWGHLGAFTDGRLLDLAALNRLQAVNAGLVTARVVDSGYCTFQRAAEFPSHRRDANQRGQIHTMVWRTT